MSMRIEPDDDITTIDGRDGIVIGIDGSYITVLPCGNGEQFRCTRAEIATINQQETRPRAGLMNPPKEWT